MEGKHSLKHLYNKGKSSQMKPQEFIELMNWFDQNANGMIDEAVEVTEKIDGSSNFIGYDGRIYVETFGFDKKFYDENDFDGNPYEAKARALLDYATSLPDLEDYLEDLCNDNNCASIKLQIEMLLTKFSKSEEYCQIVLVPYMYDKLGKDGNGFIIQVLNGDTLEPVKDEKLAVETLCDIMSTENFKVTGTNPKQFDPIDIKEDIQEVKDIIATYTEKMGKSVEEILSSRKKADAEMKKALKAEIEAVQEALQDKLTEAFPVGDYGDYYEGLVFKLTNGMMFKVTSKKFKQFIAEHNHWTENVKLTEAIEKTPKSIINEFFDGNSEALKSFLTIFGTPFNDNNGTCYIGFNGNNYNLSIKAISTDQSKYFMPIALSDDRVKQLENSLITFTKNYSKYEFKKKIDKGHIIFEITDNSRAKNKTLSVKVSKDGKGIFTVLDFDEASRKAIIDFNNNVENYTTTLSSTNVQEALTGLFIECIAKDEFIGIDNQNTLSSKISKAIEKLHKYFETTNTVKLSNTIGIKKDILNKDFELVHFENDYAIEGLTKSALLSFFDSSWEKSMQLLETIRVGKILKSYFDTKETLKNTFVFHPSLKLLTSEISKKDLDDIESCCMTSQYKDETGKSIKRDLVNPSDIYFIDRSKIREILDSFKNVPQTRADYINWHNEMTSNDHKCFIGISLKKLTKKSHASISGDSLNISYKEKEDGEDIALDKKVFYVDLTNPSNSTLDKNSLSYTFAASPDPSRKDESFNFPRKQGQFALYARCKPPMGDISLTIRSNGNPTPTVEVKHLGSGAQGGKGKDEVLALLKEASSLKSPLGKLAFESLLENSKIDDLLSVIKEVKGKKTENPDEGETNTSSIPEFAIPVFGDNANKVRFCKTTYNVGDNTEEYYFIADDSSMKVSGNDKARNLIPNDKSTFELEEFTLDKWYDKTNLIIDKNKFSNRESKNIDKEIISLSARVIKALVTEDIAPFKRKNELFNNIYNLTKNKDVCRILAATILFSVCFKYPITLISTGTNVDPETAQKINNFIEETTKSGFGKTTVSYLKFG